MSAKLQAENEAQRRELAAAHARIAEQSAQIAHMALMLATMNDRLTELLAAAQRKTARPAVELKVPEPPASLGAAEAAAFTDRPKAPPLPEKPPKVNKPRRPSGRKPLPDHLPTEEHTVRPEVCTECGGADLQAVDVVVETKLHVVEAHQRKRVVRRITCVCKRCDTRMTARSLPAPFDRSKFTGEWLAWLVHQKFAMLTPLDRIRRDLAAKGIPLASGTLCKQIERAADLLAKIDGEHWKQLLAAEWLALDATSLKVLVPGLPVSHNGQLEAYRNDDRVVFQYEPSKAADTLVSKLAKFKGTIVADAEHRHNALFADGRNVEAGCNAHGRRKLRDAEKVQPVLAAEAGLFISNMYLAEREAKEKGLQGEDLKAWRQTRIPPLRDAFKRWIQATRQVLTEPSDPLLKAINYYENHWDAFFRFVDDPRIPIDNSATEREYQNVAKLRLNSLFAGSTEGAHRMAILLGIAATCRIQKVDFQAYLSWAFTRLGTHADLYNLDAAALTPARYAAFLRSER